MGARAGNDLGRFCPANPLQILSSWTPPPPPKRAAGRALGVNKIFKSIHTFYTPTPYIENTHTLLTLTPQELGKSAKSLADRAD